LKVAMWMLTHPNGQSVRCAVTFDGSAYRVQHWLNGSITSGDHFAAHEAALKAADMTRRHLERRGFRETA
jgi:hypothetical protein